MNRTPSFCILALTAAATTALPARAATPLDTVVTRDATSGGSGTTVRLLNASPDVGPVDLYVAQFREAENVSFEEISDPALITAADLVVRITPTGQTDPELISMGVTFPQRAEVTLVLTGTADDLELNVLESSGPGSNPGSAWVRFFHGSPDFGAADLAVTGGDVLHSGVEFRGSTEYLEIPGGTYDLEIRTSGETGAIVTAAGVWFEGTRFHTVFLTGLESDIGQGDDTYSYFVPAAARISGKEGSFFLTTLDIQNPSSQAAECTLSWLPRDTDNSSPTMSEPIPIPGGGAVRFDDVLATLFGLGDGAAGALGAECTLGDLNFFSRTFNVTDDGTFGQGIPGVGSEDVIRAGTKKRVVFLTDNSAFRSNLGLLNTTAAEITIRINRFLADGTLWAATSRTLPPYGNIQINGIFEDAAPVEAATVELFTDTFDGAFTAYGSVLDNPTSDPTTVLPQ
jgi:hypothetical protein